MKQHRFIFLWLLLIGFSGTLAACCTAKTPVVGNITANPGTTLSPGEQVSLGVTATGVDLSFEWKAVGGDFSTTTDVATVYTVPDNPGKTTVTLNVSNCADSVFRTVDLDIKGEELPPAQGESVSSQPTVQIEVTVAGPEETKTDLPQSPTETSLASPASDEGKQEGAGIECEGNASKDVIAQAFAALDGDQQEKALACTERVIDTWSGHANIQQTTRQQKSICADLPDPNNKGEIDEYWSENWALSDVASAWIIRGQVLLKQERRSEALEAFAVVTNQYSCALGWDPQGWFYKQTDAAIILSKQ